MAQPVGIKYNEARRCRLPAATSGPFRGFPLRLADAGVLGCQIWRGSRLGFRALFLSLGRARRVSPPLGELAGSAADGAMQPTLYRRRQGRGAALGSGAEHSSRPVLLHMSREIVTELVIHRASKDRVNGFGDWALW